MVESTEPTTTVEDETALPMPKPLKVIARLTVSPAAPSASRRWPARATPKSKPKPRHEDSQIHFEPIPSSPLPQPNPEVLTERQLEVAERQRQGSAALFAEASTPVARPMRQLGANLAEETELPVPTPSTPVLAAALDDAIPSSSPIVASVKRRESSVHRTLLPEIKLLPAMPSHHDELPSSPPAVPSDQTADLSSMPAVPSLTLDRDGILRRKRMNRQSRSSQGGTREDILIKSEQAVADPIEEECDEQEDKHTVPSTAPPETQSFNSILSNPLTMTESSDTRVQNSFAARDEEMPRPVQDLSPSDESSQDDLDPSQHSVMDDSQIADSQRKKRKRGRTSFAPTKRRKTAAAHIYNEADYIRFKPKPRFMTPDDMLPLIVVKVLGESTPELLDTETGADMDEEIQVPAMTKGSRRRPQKSHESSASQASQDATAPLKRGRSSTRLQDLDEVEEQKAKRTKTNPKTLPSRERSVSSAHYVEVTPGDASGRHGGGSTRTDTPEAEEIISMSQQAFAGAEKEDDTVIISNYEDFARSAARQIEMEGAQAFDLMPLTSSPPPNISPTDTEEQTIITNQIEKSQEDTRPDAEDEDEADDFHGIRVDSPALSIAPSQAGSQSSQSSQLSSFSVSAFRGVMSRFVNQIKEFVNGGSQQATEEVARQMADEANRTVERLARAVIRKRSG